MKNKKVLNVRTHVGGLLGKTSYDSEQDKAEMELTPVGVVLKTIGGRPIMRKEKQVEVLLTYPNCTEVIVEANNDDLPRGPGRPPKAA